MNLDSSVYVVISNLKFFTTYRGKVMVVAFVDIHIPLWTMILAAILSPAFPLLAIAPALLAILLIDVIVTIATSYVLFNLLAPIVLTSETLGEYLRSQKLSPLPATFQDEVNTLMVDNSQTLQRLDKIIQHITNYDTLTGLPKRELFQSYIKQAIANTKEDRQFALIVLDLDSLKDINSTLGRKVGDLLLTKVAQRLNGYLTSKDILARFGGDEFAILRTQIANSESLIALSHNLLNSLSEPFALHGKNIHCAAKIGITIYPFDGDTVEQLLQNADIAIHQAKQQKLNTYQFYTPEISEKLQRTLAIKDNLRYALKRQEFSIRYQPRIEIDTGRLVGVEALLRWYSPELGFVSPAEFIPIAEETNLIMPIGEWVLRNACAQNKQWQQEGWSSFRVSVNLSTTQFKQANLVATIDRILQETDLDKIYLELEITENLLVDDTERAVAILWELKRRGISIALDDFGTGYSSLSYLQKLPIDTLKIDRSFVTNIATNSDDAAISKAIVALAQSLELNITAEGVETKAQLDYLRNLGCHEAQGYYLSEPLSSDRLKDFFATYCGRQ